MDKDFMLPSFDEDSFNLDEHKKAASAYARVTARAVRVRRRIGVAKVLLVIALFAAGYGIYYLATELISYIAFSLSAS